MPTFATGAALTAALNKLAPEIKGTYQPFNAFYYAQKYMVGTYSGTLTPIEHFVQIGAAMGNEPNANFDPTYYQSRYSDLAGFDAAELLYHYVAFGLNEGRAGNAELEANDWAAYLTAYPAVADYVNANLSKFGGSATNGAIAHYVKFGAQQGFTLPNTVSQTFTLTADQNNFVGNEKDDVFNSGMVLSDHTQEPFGSFLGDTLDGQGGDDTLNITTSTGGFFTSSNIENINIRTMAAGPVTLDMADVTGVETLTAHALRSALTLVEVQEISDIVYKDNTKAADSDLVVDYAAAAVAGTTDTLVLTVDNNTSGGISVEGIETISMEVVGENNLNLVSPGATTLNISGQDAVEDVLDLVANDVEEINNASAGGASIAATSATTVTNEGSGDLTLTAVANKATVTNSGSGDLTFDTALTGADVTIVNSGTGNLTVEQTLAASTPGVTNVTITNSGEGNTTINGSLATIITSTGAGDLTVAEDAYEVKATITASGAGDLDVTVKDNDVTVDASASTGAVTLTVSTGGTRAALAFTGSAGDDTVILGKNALVALSDTLNGEDGVDTIEVSEDDATLSFAEFTGVTNFETILYTGDAAVTWTDLDKAGTTIAVEFGTITMAAADGANGVAGLAGADSTKATDPGANGAVGGGVTKATAGAVALDLSGTAATINAVLTGNISTVGGNGGAGGAGGVGFLGVNATAAAAAVAGTAGGDGGAGEAGAAGATVLTTNATTFTLTLNGVTLNSSGGNGGAGGNGGKGAAGGNGAATVNVNGEAGGDGGNGGAGGAGGAAADTVFADQATTVTIISGVSTTSTVNTLTAAGGAGGAGGQFGTGGLGGIAGGSKGTGGANGNNGTAGVAGAAGAEANGLVVGDGATVTITGAGDLNLGVVAQAAGATKGLTIDADDATLGALTGDLTMEIDGSLNDTITGGDGAHDITLNGGADTIDLSASATVADSITLNAATGTDVATSDEVEITGFDLGLDTVTVANATSVANTNIQLVAAAPYADYEYKVTDGVVVIGKGVNDPLVGATLFEDIVEVIFADVFDVGTAGEAVVWSDGDDSWLFVSDGIAGYLAGADYAVKLVGVEVTDIADVLVLPVPA